MNLGEKIKSIRNKNGLTQDELATKAKVSKNAIWNYENNKRQPKYKTIQDIAEALGVSASYLLSLNNSFSIELLAAIQKSYGEKFCNGSIKNESFIESLSNELNIDEGLLFEVFYNKCNDLPISIQKELLKYLLKLDSDVYYEFIKEFNFDMSSEIKLFVESMMIDSYKNLESSNLMAFKNYLFTTFGDKIKEFVNEDNLKELYEESEKFLEFALYKLEKIFYGENDED